MIIFGPYFNLMLDYLSRQIAVRGDFDVATAPNLARAVAALQRAAAGDITIRLDDLSFIDTSGVGAILAARDAQLLHGDRLLLTGASTHLQHVFARPNLSELLNT